MYQPLSNFRKLVVPCICRYSDHQWTSSHHYIWSGLKSTVLFLSSINCDFLLAPYFYFTSQTLILTYLLHICILSIHQHRSSTQEKCTGLHFGRVGHKPLQASFRHISTWCSGTALLHISIFTYQAHSVTHSNQWCSCKFPELCTFPHADTLESK